MDADEAGVECVARAGGAGEGAQVQVGGGRRPAAAPRARALGAQSLVSSRGRRVARPAVRRRRRADSDRWRRRPPPARSARPTRSLASPPLFIRPASTSNLNIKLCNKSLCSVNCFIKKMIINWWLCVDHI